MRTLCFGEAIVDLICRRPVTSLAEVDVFVPHCGGVSANVAVAAARGGAAVSLAGGTGDDQWGAWLHDRLAAEHVDLRWFGLADGLSTSLAFVTVDSAGEPSYQLYGDGIAAAVSALNDRLLEAVEACDALLFTSNTLAGAQEAMLTMGARERALELGRPIVFDPNVRLRRWDDSPARAAAAAGDCVPGAFLVKCNAAEGRMLTGESDPEAVAASLLAAGAQHVIVTSGERGAILRGGGLRHHVAGRPAAVVSTTGAGDVFLGTLLARLGTTDFYPPALAAG
ncbi:MAG: PfkB family carbohydrate kinase, partial [Actinomycetota bacterium]|nr:PfkB family carbohydrate kinase [Actinomycetota bacterium]